MFKPNDHARVFGLSPGTDFPTAFVKGLREHLGGAPPHAMAKVNVIVNTRRMQRRLREIFDQGPPGFLPRILLLTDLQSLAPEITLGDATAPLRRRLELTQLVSRLLQANPELAPRTSLYALSDSLANLLDEMQSEGVEPATISALDVSDQSGHWARAQQFLGIAHNYLLQISDRPDAETRQRQFVEKLITHWKETPPADPIIMAGSTGSRGTTSLLMQAVAGLPQGAVVLPGFDFDMPTAVWSELENALMSQDHPQYRFHHLMKALQLPRAGVTEWTAHKPPAQQRNRLISLAMRPAPVTHAWLTEGPKLDDINGATNELTLIEAPTPRAEALAIALRMRKAIDDGQSAALITPDRMLTRQVTAALDRWNILPDDSAGTPLQLSPPGRFLRHVSGLFAQKLDAEALLTLLKHPLTHSEQNRNLHQLHTQRLELAIRDTGLPYPSPDGLIALGKQQSRDGGEQDDAYLKWLNWVADTFCQQHVIGELPLTEWMAKITDLAQVIACGPDETQATELWNQKAGQQAKSLIDGLAENAQYGGALIATDFADLLNAILSQGEVRDRDAPHPNVMIWGTLEARVQGADLVILGGLNDGTWPEAPAPDPWLNRAMRLQAGMLLPERRIGLSAHDFQQAIGAAKVCLTRAVRSDEAETVPSRWLNRLGNLLNGLPKQGGEQAWQEMKTRGNYWLQQVRALEEFDQVKPAHRPSPRPPVFTRPRRLSVTEIEKLIRDPYAIYAKHILKLKPLRPLVQSPDAPMRGTVLHKVFEVFIKSILDNPENLNKPNLLALAKHTLSKNVPWPAARAMWLARIERIADWFITQEQQRQSFSTPIAFERGAKGTHTFPDLGFEVRFTADRVDQSENGDLLLYDYKTGNPPTKKQQQQYDKQLLIEAAIIEAGGLGHLGPVPVDHAAYIGLGSNPKEVPAPLEEEPPSKIMSGLHKLLSDYLVASQGFTARRVAFRDSDTSDYDQLSRFGEWDSTDTPLPEDLT